MRGVRAGVVGVREKMRKTKKAFKSFFFLEDEELELEMEFDDFDYYELRG